MPIQFLPWKIQRELVRREQIRQRCRETHLKTRNCEQVDKEVETVSGADTKRETARTKVPLEEKIHDSALESTGLPCSQAGQSRFPVFSILLAQSTAT